MHSVQGKILSITGENVTVGLSAAPACPRCAAGKGCGAGLFGNRSAATVFVVDLPQPSTLQPGDAIVLTLDGTRLLHASLLVYGLPLAGALLATCLGWLFFQPLTDVAGVILAVAGLAAGLLVSHRYLLRNACLRQFVPTIGNDATDAS
jgi:sigma-E factor negative regulatory protein RseC